MLPYKELTSLGRILPEIFSLLLLTGALCLLIQTWMLHTDNRKLKKNIWHIRREALVLTACCLLLTQGLADAEVRESTRVKNGAILFLADFLENQNWLLILTACFLLLAGECSLYMRTRQKKKRLLTPMAIKESLDALPDGVGFVTENGSPVLVNVEMNHICNSLYGTWFMNGEQFWYRLKEGDIGKETEILQESDLPGETLPEKEEDAKADSVLIRTEDGKIWDLRRSRLEPDKDHVIQLTAYDVTTQYRLWQELSDRNRRLNEVNERLHRFNSEVERVTREQEILSAKIRVHDEVGRSLLTLRTYLAQAEADRDRKSLVPLWQYIVSVMREEVLPQPENTAAWNASKNWEVLQKKADAMRITIQKEGILPDTEKEARLILAAVQECVSNTAKHAGGHIQYVKLFRTAEGFRAELTNDGQPPRKEPEEKGGLKNLRLMIERAGGTMLLQSTPRFVMEILLPGEKRNGECDEDQSDDRG